MRNRLALPTLLLASLTLAGTGCVSQGQLDDARKMNRTLEENLSDVRLQLKNAEATLAEMKARRDENAALVAKLRASNEDLTKQLGALKAQYAELAKHKGDLIINQALPTALNNALANFAAANPDLMTYDAATGMIRLKSDLTFGLGSTTLNDGAADTIKKLAEVLNREDASPYEVRVVGHTDDVPVTSAANKARVIDNWGLSAARAQAVLHALRDGGVQENRMALVGYGEQNPVVENAPAGENGKKKGAAANRRVEIYLREAVVAKAEVKAEVKAEAKPEAPAGVVKEAAGEEKFENVK